MLKWVVTFPSGVRLTLSDRCSLLRTITNVFEVSFLVKVYLTIEELFPDYISSESLFVLVSLVVLLGEEEFELSLVWVSLVSVSLVSVSFMLVSLVLVSFVWVSLVEVSLVWVSFMLVSLVSVSLVGIEKLQTTVSV